MPAWRYPGCQRLFMRGFRFPVSAFPRVFSRGFAARVFGLRPNTCRPAAGETKLPVAREKNPLVPRVAWRSCVTLTLQPSTQAAFIHSPITTLSLLDSIMNSTTRQYTVNSVYSGHCRDPELVSTLARVRNSGSLFQSNVCDIFLSGI